MFGLRFMWASMAEAGRRFSRALSADRDVAASLEAAFGPILYVHVSRNHKVAQAISRLWAEQSGLWHLAADGSVLEGTTSPRPVAYDGAPIAELVAELESDEVAWCAFLEARGINSLRLVYEEAAGDPQAAVASILAALALDPAVIRAAPIRTAQLSDEESRRWIERFRQEQGR